MKAAGKKIDIHNNDNVQILEPETINECIQIINSVQSKSESGRVDVVKFLRKKFNWNFRTAIDTYNHYFQSRD